MYLEHFGLTDFPFIQSARNELYFSTDESVAYCSAVHHWLDAGHGMLAISGEMGVGRASLAHHALDTAPLPILERYVVSSLPLNPAELLTSIALDMGLVLQSSEPIQIRHEIRSHLRAQASLSRRVCLIVHDANKLDDQTHAFLEDLSKDHTLYLPLCHIILLVNKPFAARISKQKRVTGARQFHKLLNIRALTLQQTGEYIDYRLSHVGSSHSPKAEKKIFPTAIVKLIHQQTSGKLHLINVLCDTSLVESFLNNQTVVAQRHLRAAVGIVGWDNRLKPALPTPPTPSPAQKSLGALEQSVHELISGVTTIGRAPDCSIRIDSNSVSPYQALIVRTAEGMFIRNEATQLPLFLNGSRVESANLSAGDTVSLSHYEFLVELDVEGVLTLVSTLANTC